MAECEKYTYRSKDLIADIVDLVNLNYYIRCKTTRRRLNSFQQTIQPLNDHEFARCVFYEYHVRSVSPGEVDDPFL
ncbi:hypothetical protein YC2023_047843 [Brassica napus]